jgi:hypothetical protein
MAFQTGKEMMEFQPQPKGNSFNASRLTFRVPRSELRESSFDTIAALADGVSVST